MADINLLIVEDEKQQLETYVDAIDEHNNNNENIIKYKVQEKAEDCINLLKSNEFDAAIVDLNLEGDSTDGASGNEVLKEIMKSHRFPIFVVTGTPGWLDKAIEKSIFLQVIERTSVNNLDLLKMIEKFYLTGITKILGTRGKLEDLIQIIFWDHISDGFNYWLEKGSEEALLRYSINHLTEYIDQTEKYYEPEQYITPPIKRGIATGDIVEKDGNRFVVMNPACDIATRVVGEEVKRNSRVVTLVEILDLNEDILKSEGYIEQNKSLNRDKIRSFVSNSNGQFAFLPKYNNITCGIIDFKKISTIQFTDYCNCNRLATIAMPFLKDIQSRFSQYYGRQGQPDLDKDRIVNELSRT